MNLLPIVLGVLLVLSWASTKMQESHLSFRKLQSMFVSLKTAERKCQQKEMLRAFNKLPGKKITKQAKIKSSHEKTKKQINAGFINPNCAKLNLFSIQKNGLASSKELIFSAKSLFLSLYGSFFSKEDASLFFQAFIEHVANPKTTSLETIQFEDLNMQMTYYRLLKGMRSCNLFTSQRIPPLGDYFKFDPKGASTICGLHANPHALIPYFGKSGAMNVFIHLAQRKSKTGIGLEEIFLASKNQSVRMLPETTWASISFSHSQTGSSESSQLVASDEEVSIRRRAK